MAGNLNGHDPDVNHYHNSIFFNEVTHKMSGRKNVLTCQKLRVYFGVFGMPVIYLAYQTKFSLAKRNVNYPMQDNNKVPDKVPDRVPGKVQGESTIPVTSLSSLSRGQEATVAEICGGTALATRLREFGCLQGAAVRVLRVGSTLMVQLGELRLCIRRHDAELILVKLAQVNVGSNAATAINEFSSLALEPSPGD